MTLQLLVPGQDHASGSEDTSVCATASRGLWGQSSAGNTVYDLGDGGTEPKTWGKPLRHELACFHFQSWWGWSVRWLSNGWFKGKGRSWPRSGGTKRKRGPVGKRHLRSWELGQPPCVCSCLFYLFMSFPWCYLLSAYNHSFPPHCSHRKSICFSKLLKYSERKYMLMFTIIKPL